MSTYPGTLNALYSARQTEVQIFQDAQIPTQMKVAVSLGFSFSSDMY